MGVIELKYLKYLYTYDLAVIQIGWSTLPVSKFATINMWDLKGRLGPVDKYIMYFKYGVGEMLAPDPHLNSTMQYVFGRTALWCTKVIA